MTQQPADGVVGVAVAAARSAADAVHDLGSRAVDAALDMGADAVRPAYERLGRAAEAADERPGPSKEDMVSRDGKAGGAGAAERADEERRT